jgi:hypothetical protein
MASAEVRSAEVDAVVGQLGKLRLIGNRPTSARRRRFPFYVAHTFDNGALSEPRLSAARGLARDSAEGDPAPTRQAPGNHAATHAGGVAKPGY